MTHQIYSQQDSIRMQNNHNISFERWLEINESFASGFVKNVVGEVENALEPEMGTIYSVPNFKMFKRSGEPAQDVILFTNDAFQNFTLNFTGDTFYSADFWSAGKGKPEVTLYANGRSLTELLPWFPSIAKNPSPSLELERFERSVTEENENDQQPKLEKPKVQIELEPTELKNVPGEVVPNTNAEEGEYDWADPETIFEDLAIYIDMVIEGTQPSLIITGSPGVGKTYTVTERLKKAGLVKNKDWVAFTGSATAVAMYQALYEFNGKIILFDDIDRIWGDKTAVNVLKGALDSKDVREISWLAKTKLETSAGEPVPQRFEFTGRIIFISNLAQKKLDSAIKSRSFVVEVALTPDDMVEYIADKLPYIMPESSMGLKKVALSVIKKAAKIFDNVQINMRTLVKAVKILSNPKITPKVAQRLIMQQSSYD